MSRKSFRDMIAYEIYPTSFYDSNGDGTGDLAGITEKLDYIAGIGFNAIWLNPFYRSPFKDGGYDISDFFDVDPRFGTLADFDALVKRAHELGISISSVSRHIKRAKNKLTKTMNYYFVQTANCLSERLCVHNGSVSGKRST